MVAMMYDEPFVEKHTGLEAQLIAVAHCTAMSTKRMPADSVMWLVNNARQHYSPAALEQRAKNRIAWMEARYPDRGRIIIAS